MTPQAPGIAARRLKAALRVALSHYVANGLSVALGLLLISGGVHLWLGDLASTAAAVGVIIAAPPDLPAPRRGKLRQMLAAPLLGLPLFFAVQSLHAAPLRLALVLVPATFVAFVAMAWGKRGIPIAIAVMFSIVFSMATPAPPDLRSAAATTLHVCLGVGLYVLYATLANLALNARYRVTLLADTLLALAALMRTQARQYTPTDHSLDLRESPPNAQGQLLAEHAALADQLQSARDIVLESPRTPRRQQLAGMLVVVIEVRDHLLAAELDLDALKSDVAHTEALAQMRQVLRELALEVTDLADALLLGRRPEKPSDRRPRLAALSLPADAAAEGAGPSPALLARALADRIGHINDEVRQMVALTRGEAQPDLAVVRANWQMFVSPTTWSLMPFMTLWHWDAPPLRHALRATLAVASGYAIALAMPWGTHDYWILLTIVVVLRGSLSQTLERRNARVAGTLLGCVLAVALLSAHPGPLALLAASVVAQAIAHGFAVRRYLVTAVAATVLGLVQAHLLNTGAGPTFALAERIADTLIGAAVAWGFSYVLPSWERSQVPALIRRTLMAQARHVRVALGLGQLTEIEGTTELEWRLARREAFDSLSALVQATQRSLSEPRAVRPDIETLERLQAHSYQLLAQVSAVKAMLLLRRDRLPVERISAPLAQAAVRIEATLHGDPAAAPVAAPPGPRARSTGPIELPEPTERDISPWLLRRLDLASDLADQLQADAARILRPTPSGVAAA